MRDILFRGKSVDSKEWIFGGIVCLHDFYGKGKEKCLIVEDLASESGNGVPEEAIPETVGQYSGLEDGLGDSIFEGDILQFNWPEVLPGDNPPAIMLCDRRYIQGGHVNYLEKCDADISRIIGNIHETKMGD